MELIETEWGSKFSKLISIIFYVLVIIIVIPNIIFFHEKYPPIKMNTLCRNCEIVQFLTVYYPQFIQQHKKNPPHNKKE